MKLLMITGLGSARDLASGKRGAFYNTLEEFSKYWDRIDIICPKISRSSTSRGLEVEPLFGNVYLHISPWPLIFHPLWFLKKALKIYREQKFDLMTVHEFPPFYNGIAARLLWQKIKVPYVLEIHHIPGYPRAAGFKEEMYKILTRLFIEFDSKKAKAIRVVNKNQASKFLIESGVPKEKIVYIPSLYIDFDVFKPMDLPKEYDLIFVGRLEKNKGVDLLLKACRLLITDYHLRIKLLIVGDGLLKKYLVSRIKYYGLEDNIKLHGWAKNSQEIAEFINKSKILVMPSYNEGGPRVVAEAMACGVPVLATLVGVVPDLLKDSRGGEIISWDAEDISKKVEQILRNYEIYRNSGIETVKQFEKKMAIKNYAEELKKLI